jgi:outer membrane protein insertion porin family
VGGRLVVTVVENAVIGRIAIEGNKKVRTSSFQAKSVKPRGVLAPDGPSGAAHYRNLPALRPPRRVPKSSSSRTTASTTSSRSLKAARRASSRSVRRQRRLFVLSPEGHHQDAQIQLLKLLGGNDLYDPDRVEADRDLIRRFYLKNGYADVQVVAALTEYDPEKKGFLISFKIEEGQQYRVVRRLPDLHRDPRYRLDAQLLARQRRLGLQCRGA